MKYAVALFSLLVIAGPVSAQDYAIDKGAFALDRTISYSSDGGELWENADGDRMTTILLNPSVLYCWAPGLAVDGEPYVPKASQGDFSFTTIGTPASL